MTEHNLSNATAKSSINFALFSEFTAVVIAVMNLINFLFLLGLTGKKVPQIDRRLDASWADFKVIHLILPFGYR